MKRIAIGAALGGMAAYVSGRIQGRSQGDSQAEAGESGSGKQSVFRRIGGAVRGGGGKVAGAGQAVGGQAAGLAQKAGHGVSGVAHKAGEGAAAVAGKVTGGGGSPEQDGAGDERSIDDVTLARKVESEIFRDADAPKGSVNVNVQEGVVQLRGEVEGRELIDELVQRARDVQGVEDVENLLHLPGEPAPMHQ